MLTGEEEARRAFAGLGAVEVTRRDGRWLALGAEVAAFLADDDAGFARLQTEGALARRWRASGVPAFEVLAEDPGLRLQVRRRLDGVIGEVVEPRLFGTEPTRVDRYGDAPITPFGLHLARSYGTVAARMHGALTVAEGRALGLGPRTPVDLDDAAARLAAYGAAAEVRRAFERARAWVAAAPPIDAVIHGDLHFHNVCLDEDGAITGVFDLGDAGLCDRGSDLLYVHSLGPRFVAEALAAYAAVAEVAVDLDAVRRAHLEVAVGHLQWHPPGRPRHASVLRWVGEALLALAP